jgi:signal peptidase I
MSDGPEERRLDPPDTVAEPAKIENTDSAITTVTADADKEQGENVPPGLSPAAKKPEEEMPWWKEWVELLVRAGFWALLIYLFVFQVSVVDGTSMYPSFENSDKLVIDKLTYRFSSVRRFDVVVFETIDLERPDQLRQTRDYIKRVVGLPGEKVAIRNGRVFINDSPVPLKETFLPGLQETYPTGVDQFVVPKGHYFVLGDNRKGSHDSRAAGMGFVPVGQIKGLVRMRWWPWDRFKWFSRESSD